jgi:hypothetical protein
MPTMREGDPPAALGEATGLPLEGRGLHVKPPGARCIQRLSIRLDGDRVVLSTYPAELQDQARAFYRDPSRVARVLDLDAAEPWRVRPNGHLSYWLAAPERRWYFAHGTLGVADYMHRWQEDLGAVHSYERGEVVTELWPWLLRRGYAGEADRPAMDEFLVRSRPRVHLRPGVWISRSWPLAEAERLHAGDGLTAAIREAVDTILATFGEPPLRS